MYPLSPLPPTQTLRAAIFQVSGYRRPLLSGVPTSLSSRSYQQEAVGALDGKERGKNHGRGRKEIKNSRKGEDRRGRRETVAPIQAGLEFSHGSDLKAQAR